jgi:hypothetical protein
MFIINVHVLEPLGKITEMQHPGLRAIHNLQFAKFSHRIKMQRQRRLKKRAQAKQPALSEELPLELRHLIVQDASVKDILAWCTASKQHSVLCDDPVLWKALLWRDFRDELQILDQRHMFGEYNPLGNDKLRYKVLALMKSQLLKAKYNFVRIQSTDPYWLTQAATHIERAFLVTELFSRIQDGLHYFWVLYTLIDPCSPADMLSMPKAKRLGKSDYEGKIWFRVFYWLTLDGKFGLMEKVMWDAPKLLIPELPWIQYNLIYNLIYHTGDKNLVFNEYWDGVFTFLGYSMPRTKIMKALESDNDINGIEAEIESSDQDRKIFLRRALSALGV